MTNSQLIIAIDGYSSCGKSTLARSLADSLDYLFIDTGAMYRAVTWYFIHNELDTSMTSSALKTVMEQIDIRLDRQKGMTVTYLNGKNVEQMIRTKEVTDQVSQVSALFEVREKIVAMQQKMAGERGLVMEGRDIGTVVFPNADLKIFLTAELEVRIDRRYQELLHKGITISRKEVSQNLQQRDHIDSSRVHGPLKKAYNAVVIDNSNLNVAEQVAMILALIKVRFNVMNI